MSDWREQVLSTIRKPQTLSGPGRSKRPRYTLQCGVPPVFIYLVDRACRRLDHSLNGWMRRAVAVQLSSQLGVPLSEILAAVPQVRRLGGKRWEVRYPDDGYDDMTGIGAFCPHPGCDGSHFR